MDTIIIIVNILLQIELGKHPRTTNPNTKKNKKNCKSPTNTTSASEVEAGVEKQVMRSKTKFPLPVVGEYVALKCFKYKDFLPHIAKLSSIDETTVQVEWLDGTYSGTWAYWKDRGKVIIETFPRRALIGAINMTASMRLKRETITSLKEFYLKTEFV